MECGAKRVVSGRDSGRRALTGIPNRSERSLLVTPARFESPVSRLFRSDELGAFPPVGLDVQLSEVRCGSRVEQVSPGQLHASKGISQIWVLVTPAPERAACQPNRRCAHVAVGRVEVTKILKWVVGHGGVGWRNDFSYPPLREVGAAGKASGQLRGVGGYRSRSLARPASILRPHVPVFFSVRSTAGGVLLIPVQFEG